MMPLRALNPSMTGRSSRGRNFSAARKRGFDQIFRQRRAADETVKPVARVVGVQRDDALKGTRLQFGLQQAHFRLGGIFPEFAVQILAAARKARGVLETGRIADGIKRKIISGGEFGFALRAI